MQELLSLMKLFLAQKDQIVEHILNQQNFKIDLKQNEHDEEETEQECLEKQTEILQKKIKQLEEKIYGQIHFEMAKCQEEIEAALIPAF